MVKRGFSLFISHDCFHFVSASLSPIERDSGHKCERTIRAEYLATKLSNGESGGMKMRNVRCTKYFFRFLKRRFIRRSFNVQLFGHLRLDSQECLQSTTSWWRRCLGKSATSSKSTQTDSIQWTRTVEMMFIHSYPVEVSSCRFFGRTGICDQVLKDDISSRSNVFIFWPLYWASSIENSSGETE